MILQDWAVPELKDVLPEFASSDDRNMYQVRGGAYNPANSMALAEAMRFKVNRHVNSLLAVENCFAWDWNPKGVMQPHTDREPLHWTVTAPLDEESAEWPICAEGHGEVTVPFGCGFLYDSRTTSHWRNVSPVPRASWIMYHYREEKRGEVVIHRNLLLQSEVADILTSGHAWEKASTVNYEGNSEYGKTRQSEVSWMERADWNWLHRRIDDRMLRIRPELKSGKGSIQLTKYEVGGYFEMHTDDGPKTPRKLSATVLLANAHAGGDLAFQDAPSLRLEPGDAVFFDSTVMHEVQMVRAGTRYSLVRWLN